MSIEQHISELHGYLRAVADCNDQFGFRHSYSAGCAALEGGEPLDLIKSRFGLQAEQSLTPSDSGSERRLIQSHSPAKVLGAKQLDARLPALTETITWRIQEHLALEDYCDQPIKNRWMASYIQNDFTCRTIFIVTQDYLVWLTFATRDEQNLMGCQ